VAALRATTEGPGPDRMLAPEIEAATQFVLSAGVLAAVEPFIGRLGE
jgi:histidine ammonia-lyase